MYELKVVINLDFEKKIWINMYSTQYYVIRVNAKHNIMLYMFMLNTILCYTCLC